MLAVPLYRQEHEYSCIAAAARMVMSYLGIEHSEAEVRRVLKTKHTGTHPLNLAHLSRWGIEVRFVQADLSMLASLLDHGSAPIALVSTDHLAHWSDSPYPFIHALVVVGYEEGLLLVNDPYFAGAPIRIPDGEFDRAWQASERLLAVLSLKP